MELKDLISGSKPLSKMNKAELETIVEGMEIDVPEKATNAMMVDSIKESGKWVKSGTTETGQDNAVATVGGKKVRVHKTLGEYKRVKFHPTEASQQKTSVFGSIGLYTMECQPRTEVMVPQGLIDMMKLATAVEHVYDPNAMNSQGRLGAHVANEVPKYIVEVL